MWQRLSQNGLAWRHRLSFSPMLGWRAVHQHPRVSGSATATQSMRRQRNTHSLLSSSFLTWITSFPAVSSCSLTRHPLLGAGLQPQCVVTSTTFATPWLSSQRLAALSCILADS